MIYTSAESYVENSNPAIFRTDTHTGVMFSVGYEGKAALAVSGASALGAAIAYLIYVKGNGD